MLQPIYCTSGAYVSAIIKANILADNSLSVTWRTSIISERRYDSLWWENGIVSNSTAVF